MGRILIIAVDYNSNFYSEKLIQSVEEMSDREKIDLHIAFTGNDQLEENILIYKKHSFNNIGYFPAAKKTFDSICDINKYEFVIICNNDVQILSKNLFYLLNRKLKKSSDVIAPSIINLNDLDQNPHRMQAPTKIALIKYLIYFIDFRIATLINYFRKKTGTQKKKFYNSTSIYSPHGAFIIFRKSYFSKGGTIDSNFFLYGEEDTIGAICNEKNMQVVYEPSILIKHYESVSTGKGLSRFKWREQKKSYHYIKSQYKDFKILK